MPTAPRPLAVLTRSSLFLLLAASPAAAAHSSLLLLLLALPATAQDLETSPCPAGGLATPQRAAQDACTQAYDVYQFMGPQLAVSLAGGNAILAQGGTLGGVGHFSFGVRGNVIAGQVPDVRRFGTTPQGAQRWSLPTQEVVVGLPTADAAIGAFGGFDVGLTSVGGLDLLISAAYVPEVQVEDVSVTPQRNIQLGYGVRVGVLEDAGLIPGLAVTYLRRDLPETDIVGESGDVTLEVTSARFETKAWRVVASKSFPMLTLAAGIGRDAYDQSADIRGEVRGTFSGQASVPGTEQSLTRTNYFVDAALRLWVLRIAAEVGRVTGGTVRTFSTFEGGRADRTLAYGSLGVQHAR